MRTGFRTRSVEAQLLSRAFGSPLFWFRYRDWVVAVAQRAWRQFIWLPPQTDIYNALYSVNVNETAACTLRGARERARLTQVELAAKANVAQSVISAYESSRREPSLETLRKLVSAAGFDLDVVLIPATPTSSRRRAVEGNRGRLLRSLRASGATNVRLFGSVARGDDGPNSDIDLLVDIAPEVGLFALGRMRSEAERILGSSVDIVPANSLKPDLADRVLAEAIAL